MRIPRPDATIIAFWGKAMKRARGFTLIELMIVVAVIAILAGLAISQYSKQVRKSSARRPSRPSRGGIGAGKIPHEQHGLRHLRQAWHRILRHLNTRLSAYNVAVTAHNDTVYTITATPKTADQLKDICGT
jgi:prepilin-type N-terminal cleavage/methylation domain-containing protein